MLCEFPRSLTKKYTLLKSLKILKSREPCLLVRYRYGFVSILMSILFFPSLSYYGPPRTLFDEQLLDFNQALFSPSSLLKTLIIFGCFCWFLCAFSLGFIFYFFLFFFGGGGVICLFYSNTFLITVRFFCVYLSEKRHFHLF